MDYFFNSLWVLGLSLLLATFSFAHWQALRRHRTLHQHIRESGAWSLIIIALLVTSLGSILAFPEWWQKVIGGGLFLWAMWQGWMVWQSWSERLS